MIEFTDYSSRRGAVVALLTDMHAMLTENAKKDTLGVTTAPEHIVSWKQKVNATLRDVNRRFVVATEVNKLVGVFFYRYEGTNLYVEDLHVAWAYRHNAKVVEGLLKKLDFDPMAKDAMFFAGERVKVESDKEILASVGFKQQHEGGWENLGNMTSAVGALKLRYSR